MIEKPSDNVDVVYKRLTLAYVSALVIIAILTIVMNLFLAAVNQNNQKSAEIINIAGRQRMLSQKTGWLAMEYAQAKPEDRIAIKQKINQATALMVDSHEYLRGDVHLGFGGDPLGMTIQEQYHGPVGINQALEVYVLSLQNLVKAATDDERTKLYQQIVQQNDTLLEKFDLVVTAYQENSRMRVDRISQMSFMIELCLLVVMGLLALFVFRPVVRRVCEQQEKLIAVAHTDPLTGLLNRRTFLQVAEKITLTCRRLQSNCSVLFVDIDHFKRINDTLGHAAGDEVLVRVAQGIASTLRGGDVVGRIGGEECVVILPDADEKQAMMVGERIRHIISTLNIRIHGEVVATTASIGTAQAKKDDKDIGETLMRADYAMYQAKQAGRNRVERYGQSELVQEDEK